jgi:hypothetical protein
MIDLPNRDQLNAQELKDAYNHSFHAGKAIGKKVVYTDAGTILNLPYVSTNAGL